MPELATGDPVPELTRWLEDHAPTTFFAAVAGEIVGYAYYQLLSGVGYVRNVVVAPHHQRQGHGRALMNEVARRFRAGGASTWCLNVKPENAAAIALYRAVGMAKAYDSVVLRMGWDAVERLPGLPGGVRLPGGAGLRAGGQRIVAREVRPDEDEAVRSAFDLLPGQLAEVRQHSTRRVLGLFEDSVPRGVAALNLSFGTGLGSFPFRVSRPDLARDLLDAMRAYAGPEHVWAQVVIDGDPPLVDTLLAAGAAVRMRIEHHRGMVPA
jgi:GNAT superfamily N-acetyltransferase